MAYFLDDYPVSENCANLVLTGEQEKNCRVVYKLDDEGGAYIFEPWDPEAKYSDEYVVFPIKSTGARSVPLHAATMFANVMGSGSDPKVGGKSWLKLWVDVANGGKGVSSCAANDKFYYMNGTVESTHDNIIYPKFIASLNRRQDTRESAVCGGSLVGGHVIVNATSAAYVPQDGLVYIIPICDKHNVSHTSGKNWGEGFYMKLSSSITAVELEGYQPAVRAYIEEFKDKVRHE